MNLHEASKDYRKSYTSPSDRDCDLAVMFVNSDGNCVSLRGGVYQCTDTSPHGGTTYKRVDVGRECWIKNPYISHPKDPQAVFSDLKECYE